MRRRFPIGQPRHGTHQPFAVMTHAIRLRIEYHQQSVTLTHGSGHAVLQACVILVRHHQLVYHHLHIMVLIAVQLHAWQGFAHLTIHTYVEIAFLTHLLEELLVMPLTAAHQRSKDINAFSFVILQDKIKYLFLGILHHLLAGEIRISLSRTGIQQTKVIINLCRCTHRGTWILIRGFLLDGDNRAQSRYLIHVRTFQISQEITGIG